MDPVEEAFIQAMVAMAVADGSLADAEAERICSIYRRVTTKTIDAAGVKAAAEAVLSGKTDAQAELAALRPKIPEELRPLVLQAAYLVAAVDEGVGDAEQRLLSGMAAALALDETAAEAALAVLPRAKVR